MRIGLIGAMEVEISTLIEHMENKSEETYRGRTFYIGSLKGQDVVLVRSGVGKVNAAMTVQILVDRYQVDRIVNTGVAGGLVPTMRIGDFVISTEAVQHDVDATNFGYQPGEVPQLGMVRFTADETLRELAKKALEGRLVGVYEGCVASGDQFVCTKEARQRIIEVFGASCCEMEGAAIAQAAVVNGVPWLVLRAISDQADEETAITYDQFEKEAAIRSAEVLLCMMEAL